MDSTTKSYTNNNQQSDLDLQTDNNNSQVPITQEPISADNNGSSSTSSNNNTNENEITSDNKISKENQDLNFTQNPNSDPNSPEEVNTLSQCSLNMEYSKYIIFCAFAASIASFNTGYTTAVTNIPNDIMRGAAKVNGNEINCGANSDSVFKNCIKTNDSFIWGLAIGMFALGGFFGSLFIAKIADRLGRKKAIIFANIPFIIGGLFLSTANSIWTLGIGRFFCGISSGAASVVVSSYIGEIASVKRRGVLGTILQFSVVTGIFTSSILGYISVKLGSLQSWRILLALTSVLAVVQIVVFTRSIETPRYFVMRGSIQLAHKTLQKLRKGFNIEKEFEQMISNSSYSSIGNDVKNKSSQALDSKPYNIIQALKETKYLKSIVIIIVIQMLQQFSGINGVISYSSSFFAEKLPGYSEVCTILITLLNLISTILSMYLVDKIGRKSLLLVSCFGIFISTLVMTIAIKCKVDWLIVIFVLVYIVTFAVGLGPVPWILISEMLPTKMLSAIASLSLGINWMCHFSITTSFLSIKEALGDYVFVPFCFIGLFGFIFVFVLLNETKGRTLENILQDSEK